jgi:2-keto-4-pentenoate hydratase/2-oxohepta-3-ene-1,7-dioic acid hydratase in catechol pathway
VKIARFSRNGKIAYGVVEDDKVREISGDIFGEYTVTQTTYNLNDVEILAPIIPSKLVAIGLNYVDHAEETKMPLPKVPLIFFKAPSAIIGPGQDIIIPKDSRRTDYEAELGVVIGKKARYVKESEALDYVLGYICCNDVSERDIQRSDGQFARAKSFDTFAPCGPYIVTDIDPSDLKIELIQNGVVKQSSRTSKLVFNVPQLISFITRAMTLLPGDIISTGTPAGVGPMHPGDTIEVRIEKIGSLINRVKLEE